VIKNRRAASGTEHQCSEDIEKKNRSNFGFATRCAHRAIGKTAAMAAFSHHASFERAHRQKAPAIICK
jgi:hypothetical protein